MVISPFRNVASLINAISGNPFKRSLQNRCEERLSRPHVDGARPRSHGRSRSKNNGRSAPMANDRYRDDDGYIARRGFGNDRAGYDRDRSRDATYERASDHERTPRRDYGDSAGYGSGGSARDRRDVVAEDRSSDPASTFRLERTWSRDRGYSPRAV